MTDRYSRKALDYFLNPRNAREMADPSGQGRAINAFSDVVTIHITVEKDLIQEATFQAQGCAACIATASVATEMMTGKPLDYALSLDVETLSETLDDGIPTQKLERALVTPTAIRVAVDDYRERSGHEG